MTHDSFARSFSHSRTNTIRSAFSLLEVIIAVAILAGSAMVLSSLLSLGSKYGQIAQQRTLALATANSILEEMIATNRIDPSATEITGVAGSTDPLGYRVRIAPYGLLSQSSGDATISLHQVTVDVFSADVGLGVIEQRPICSLSRIVRPKPQVDDTASLGNSQPGVKNQ